MTITGCSSFIQKKVAAYSLLYLPKYREISIACLILKKKGKGYVIASNVTTKRLFVYASEFETLKTTYSVCDYSQSGSNAAASDPGGKWKSAWMESVISGAVIVTGNFTEEITTNSVLYTKSCANCTVQPNATNKRPDFWPNNH